MAYKQSKHLFQGMSKDLSDDKQKGIYYIDAHNIRITAREDNTLLSVTNEKGNKPIGIRPEDNESFILGQYIGHAILNDYLVLFTIYNNKSCIWRLNLSNPNDVTSKLLYRGNLGFDKDHPIETLVDYETEDIQKVYWTDGDNQPRVINIVSDSIKPNVDTQFDFVPEVFPNGIDTLKVAVDKLINTSGAFASGTIQYFISYYNKFGQESNIVWQSPLLYISPKNRGGNVSEVVTNAFRLTISTPPTTFDFLRIYSVQHTSEDTDLIGRRIIDLQIPTNATEVLTFIDTGVLGEAITPSELYYKGGVPTAIGTMAAKDQTLFLGNIRLENFKPIDITIKNAFKLASVSYFSAKAFQADNAEYRSYEYGNQLNQNGEVLAEYVSSPIIRHFLQVDSNSIRTFKYLERYRFGVQFQDRYGRWSEPVYIGDFDNNIPPRIDYDSDHELYTYLPLAILESLDQDICNALISQGYVKIRPLVVLPQELERECVAQGVICPTVYNLGDRKLNMPYAQPSWFFRPFEGNTLEYGMGLPYKHNAIIQGKTSSIAEIEKAPEKQVPPLVGKSYNDEPLKDDTFYIDQSIITLNSPDIEFADSILESDYGFRIVGVIDVTGFSGSLHMTTTNAPNNYYRTEDYGQDKDGTGEPKMQELAEGYLPTFVHQNNNYNDGIGWGIMGAGGYWFDTPYTTWWTDRGRDEEEHKYVYPSGLRYQFTVFPWQASGSLNNTSNKSHIKFNDTDWPININTSNLETKILANLRYSSHIRYFEDTDIKSLTYDLADAKTADSKINSSLQLQGAYEYDKRTYFCEIDKLLPAPENTVEDMISNLSGTGWNILNNDYFRKVYDWDIFIKSSEFSNESIASSETHSDGGGIVLRKQMTEHINTGGGAHLPPRNVGSAPLKAFLCNNMRLCTKATATHITYNSTKHMVLALKDARRGTYTVLPRINHYKNGNYVRTVNDMDNAAWSYGMGEYNSQTQMYDQASSPYIWSQAYNQTASQKSIELNSNNDIDFSNKGILLLGELYRKEIPNKYGGNTDDAIQQNVWIPAGPSINLNEVGLQKALVWAEGDTYFQRYDCLKTYPRSKEDENSIVEILSFMCESRINIAGRYDQNRGLEDNTFITDENFNLLNKGYTQKNNFYSYRTLDSRFDLEHFKTQLTWTKTKSPGALIDNWTNVTVQNTLDLDGDKGEIISLNRYKNDIIAFQPKGISQIIYNPNVQINATSGLPIEIANSGKVQGKRYLYEGVGCQNKWSICDEVYGSIYFIDNYAKSIFKLSQEGLVSLTDTKGFREWMENNNVITSWTPYKYQTFSTPDADSVTPFRTFYDKTFKDIYFVNKDSCLVYSELLGQFISFMDYNMTNAMFNIRDSFFALYNKNIYHQFEGDYNSIFGAFKDSEITFIDNLQPEMNKIFTNLEFRSDTYKNNILMSDKTFDEIRVYNEYQDSGFTSLYALIDKPYLSNIQKKFRVWRVQLPREHDSMNRINNTWAKITLRKSGKSNEKTVLHDAVVGYYI